MAKFRDILASRLTAPPSMLGLVLGAAAFLAALTPSLIPRAGPIQGAIAGTAFAAAYAFGAAVAIAWDWLGLSAIPDRYRRIARRVSFSMSACLVLVGLFKARGWQNAVHEVLGLQAVETVRPLIIAAVGLIIILSLVFLGRAFLLLKDVYAMPMDRVLPRRASFLTASILAAWSFWAVGNGFLMDAVLRGLDSAYREVDQFRGAEEPPPSDLLRSGSATSLIAWSGLGSEGRARILSGPTEDEIVSLGGAPAKTPLRVYVGLNSAESAEARAELALAELLRIGAFDRALLVIATPTGTGWVDPAAMMPLEILHHGNVATVSVQYSYLPSWLSLLVQPEYGQETARTVFNAIYGHWHSLPKTKRPRLFLFGLSLGALNSDLSGEAFDIVGDPYDGAFWVGPPFASRTWKEVTRTRTGGTPWLPLARNPAIFRFVTNADKAQAERPVWGPFRILYLQYPSDPIVFFDPQSWRRTPELLGELRPADVSTQLMWIPGVTFLQHICDMVTATTVPRGVGHVYSASHYLDGWTALTTPDGWSQQQLLSVRAWLDEKGL